MIWDLGFKIWDWKREIRDVNPKSQIQHPKFLRRGVTLMEVLISAGVTAVGLFGVLALVPLAAVQVGKGVQEDRKVVTGKGAVAEFKARGYARQEMWRTYGQNRTSGATFPVVVPGPRIYSADSMGNITQIHESYPAVGAYCFDSRFVEANKGDPRFYKFPSESPTAMHPARFPYSPTPNSELLVPPPLGPRPPLSMPRISVAASPGAGPMIAQLANEIFVSQDDLEFVIPAGDRTQPPVQLFSSDGTGTLTTQKRQSTGHFSWMATLVPKHFNGATFAGASDEYVLSIVVFYKRDPSMALNDIASATSAAEVNERVVTVSQFAGGGVSGGEVTLQATPPQTAAELDAIPLGSWIMLAGNTLSGLPDFKWYKVIGADDIDTSGVIPIRRVTLQGADWDRPEWHLLPVLPNFRPTQATIMAGVIGVYEKTIRLETSSLWTQ